jgi:DNA-binding MarR family transcriptional regulator
MNARRQAILGTLARVGREHSDATVLFHARLASFLGLHPTDYKTLSVLARLGALSAGDIARHTGLATASVTNLIDRLARKGFVRRIADAGDRRRVLVEARLERLNAARRRVESPVRSLAQLFARYSDADLAVIADFLERNAERLRHETVKLRSIGMRRAGGVGARQRSARNDRQPDTRPLRRFA